MLACVSKKLRRNVHMKKGFNLIELMVVIAIIAILASIALPMYGRYKRQTATANAVKAISQGNQLIQGWITAMYDGGDPAGDIGAGLTLDINGGVTAAQQTSRDGIITNNVLIGQVGLTNDINAGAIAIVTSANAVGESAVSVIVEGADFVGSGCQNTGDCGFVYCVICDNTSGEALCLTRVQSLPIGTDEYNQNTVSNRNATFGAACPL
jgi:prepilin-type N-terminal cleavage/methylation domain-containing protein